MKRSFEREQFLSDVLSTAVEGGINYWALVSGYQWSEDDPSITVATVREGQQSGAEKIEPVTVTIDVIANAIHQILDGKHSVNSQIVGWLYEGNRDNDAGNIDADVADCIMQVAVLGEIVYG